MLSVARYPHDIFLDCFPNEWALYKGNRDKVRYNMTEKLLQALETNLLIVPCLNYLPSQESIHYRKKIIWTIKMPFLKTQSRVAT